MRLDIKAFGLACGLFWGFGLFFVTWWIIAFFGASGELTLIGHIYHGYNISPLGSIFGLIWGLLDGFIGGIIFAWLYNFFVGRTSVGVAGDIEPATGAVDA